MNKKLYAWLEGLAQKDLIVHYEDGYKKFGINGKNPSERNRFGEELGKCSEHSYKNKQLHDFLRSCQ